MFDLHRFHAVFTTSDLDTVAADKIHRQHAVIEQANAGLKASTLAHLPSGTFTTNAAWFVVTVMAFNLTLAAGGDRRPQVSQGNHVDDPTPDHLYTDEDRPKGQETDLHLPTG